MPDLEIRLLHHFCPQRQFLLDECRELLRPERKGIAAMHSMCSLKSWRERILAISLAVSKFFKAPFSLVGTV